MSDISTVELLNIEGDTTTLGAYLDRPVLLVFLRWLG